MTNQFPPNTDPGLFSLVAVAAGAVLTGDFDANELNAIGNWIELVAQYILTFAAQQQLIESRIENTNININSKRYKKGGSPYSTGKSNQTQRDEVDYLLKALAQMQEQLKNLTK